MPRFLKSIGRTSPLGRRMPPLVSMIAMIAVIALTASSAPAQRPTALRLLPKETLGFLRISDVHDLVEKYQQTSVGRIVDDPEVKPFLTNLYGSAVEAFETLRDQMGVSLPELLDVPQGEICVAVVKPKTGPLAIVVLLDVREDSETVELLVEKAEAALSEGGAKRTTEEFEETELVIHEGIGDNRGVIHFIKDGTVVVCSDRSVTEDILLTWNGKADAKRQSLLDNRKFVTIMRRCSGTREDRPQITYFADPMAIAGKMTEGDFSGQTALLLASQLGLNGVQGVGGSIILAPEEFDSISHMHILLDNPRAGVLEMLAFKPADLEPEPWVPADAATYMTINWDVHKTYELINRMVDEFNGDGAFDVLVETRVNQPAEINLKEDVIDVLDGRLTYVNAMEMPARLNSGVNLIGIKFKDVEHFRARLEELLAKYEDRYEEQRHGGETIYTFAAFRGRGGNGRRSEGRDDRGPNQFERDPDRGARGGGRNGQREDDEQPGREFPEGLRRPQPCVAIVGDYLLLSDSVDFMKKALDANGDVGKSLPGLPDYRRIADTIREQSKGVKPAMVSYSNPEESMRWMFELARSENTREFARGAGDNPALKAFEKAMEENPLPEFETLRKYLAPSGGLMISDETGFHFMSFSLRRE